MGDMDATANVDFLVVGAGPAGAACGAFLGQNGMKGFIITKAPSTADTPRAHIFNPFGLECLRDIGLEQDALRQATRGSMFQSFRWCRSIVGEEYGKVYAWGAAPHGLGDVALATPCESLDLPQSYLEPILVKYASQHGFEVRYSTTLVGVVKIPEAGFACTIRDGLTQNTLKVNTKYLFGADGARSQVSQSLGFRFLSEPTGGYACNVLLRAEIGHLMLKDRVARLNWIMRPDRTTFFGMVPTLRLVRPWGEWLLVCFCTGNVNQFADLTASSPEIVECVREAIGDDAVDIEILSVDSWVVRETVAERYSTQEHENAFLLGDAAHRHPPAYGLGSNTCVQDAYNLAWKAAFVAKGLAGPRLLQSYNDERQPVGASLVRESNHQLRGHAAIWEVLGMMAPTGEEGMKQVAELYEATEAGHQRRKKLHDALEQKRGEVESLGLQGNQWYTSSAVYLDDEDQPRPVLEGDPLIKFQRSTYPGSRLPHAWLDVPTRKRMISTQDIAGKASFCLLTGNGGDAWRQAASKVATSTGIPIKTFGIGFGLDYVDVYREWCKIRGVDEDGCVLVRPDRFVAWRSSRVLGSIAECESRLLRVFDRILSRDDL
ncbi:FAD binding domain-containing protein [Xylariaceae sp. FL0016]|nr:FAD binding domain-containing protein [Xylariaceae sp. FL0016]